MEHSQKHQNFVAAPMRQKAVTELAGIGDVLGERLRKEGFGKAYHVLGKFLLLDMDEEKFKAWLGSTCYANPKQQSECYHCLVDWCQAFL